MSASQDTKDGRALRLLHDALPLGWFITIQWADTFQWSISAQDGTRSVDDPEFRSVGHMGASVSEVATVCLAALRAL